MAKELVEILKQWRAKKAQQENAELYLVMQNQTIESIAEVMPQNKEEFISIKGLGERKYEKYGEEILALVNGTDETEKMSEEEADDNIYSVSKFLDLINSNLSNFVAKVKGEVSSVDVRSSYLFFTIKDAEDDSSMSCFMWTRDYEPCGIELEIGMEIMVHGSPDIYKPSGRFSLRADTVELVGEGALKKAYDELKKKLIAEGIFDESKKREIPVLPARIGLITSKTGAVIHDFGNNLGRFGFVTKFYDSRVEGSLAVRELIEAVKYFKDQEIDVLVVIRGGGSLESLQAFNNEALIRQIVNYPVPVLCGIGHDRDAPLFTMAADKAFSTPTAVAKELNSSWERAVYKLDHLGTTIINKYQPILLNSKNIIDKYYSRLDLSHQLVRQKIGEIKQIGGDILHNYSLAISESAHSIRQFQLNMSSHYQRLARLLDITGRLIGNIFVRYQFIVRNYSSKINELFDKININFDSNIESIFQTIKNSGRLIDQNNPSRQLKLGYSIIFSEGKVVKSIHQVYKNDKLISRISDGEIVSSVEEIKDKENHG